MSDPALPLSGAHWNDGIARIEECALQGMITVRGDLSAASLQNAITDVAGAAVPDGPAAVLTADHGVLWMSPDELLILCPYQEVASTLATLQDALKDAHALVVNVSDARAMFRVSGPHARDVIAKLAPVDTAPEHFPAGAFRRTRLAQVPAALFVVEDAVQLICFRSVAQYVFDLLKAAAIPGSEVSAS